MILSARDISQRLSNQAEPFAKWIFPQGVKDGNNWSVGSVDGEAGKSLKVCISGPKAGVWADFSGSDKGDLLTLISATRKISLAEAIKVAKEWLGIREPESVVPRKNYSKPAASKLMELGYESPVFKYLVDERGLDDETIRAFKVFASYNNEAIAFPSFSPDGNLENVSHIFLKRENGKKKVLQEKGCAPTLFGWQTISESPRQIVISEGQIDAMTWYQVGFPCLSVPNGCENLDWIEYDWDNLQQFDTIYLAFDDDASGQKAVKEVAARLGIHRCLMVKIAGFKDANEALQEMPLISTFENAIKAAKPLAPEQIRSPIEFKDKVVEKFYPRDGIRPGFWPNIFDRELGMRPGEVTVWTGIAGHGKSVMLTQLMVDAMQRGFKCAIASMEMRGEATLHRMLSQSEMNSAIEISNIEKILDWLAGRLWIYDIIGNVSPKKILELMEYSSARHGVNHFVIDSLMKCSVGSDDYDAQRIFLNDLCGFAKTHDCHVHLVAHARKGRDESESPGKLDVSGSANIINQADNILTVWRNKEKEQKRYDRAISDEEAKTIPDAIVYCNKQRENGDEFKKRMYYIKPVFRFYPQAEADIENLSILRRIERERQAEMALANSSNPEPEEQEPPP